MIGPLNEPRGTNWKFTGWETEFCGALTVTGEEGGFVTSGLTLKSTTRSTTGCKRTLFFGSEPVP
jgi:hypothetical protein